MGVRQRRARAHARTHVVAFSIAGFIAFQMLLMATLLFSLTMMVNNWLEDLPDYQSADAYLVPEPTTIYAADGTVIAEYYLQNRRIIDMDQVSQYVLTASVDTEDIRFYKHNGVDPQAIIRAVIAQLSGSSEGASTITQQLVRNTVLSDEQFDYSLKRKVREAYIAIQMEKMYTKDQILMMYLNTIYYGDGAYGIQAASINYFNKNASDLTLSEAALLCGLPQAPSAYDPTVNPDLATKRRNVVLMRMFDAGDITKEQYDEAVNEELVLNHGAYLDPVGPYPYFSDYVQSLLLEDFDYNTILQGGLHVYTTLDTTWQRYAEEAVREQLDVVGDPNLQFGLAAIEPSTGYIKAIVGGRDYEVSQFNTATQARRQPGSSMKMFTLATAISQGMNPSIMLNANSPLKITDDWEVQNYGNASYGTVTLRYATEESLNTPYAQVALAVGIENVIATAHAMGIDVDLPPYPSVALGSAGIPPVQMAEAYATLAADGVHREGVAITRIEDRNGNVIYEHVDTPEQVLAPEVAEAVTDVLKGTVRGAGTAAILSYNFNIPVDMAGKSGTSSGARDLWFVGYTPSMACAVWCGYLEESMIYVYGYEGHGYQTSVPVWGRFAEKLYSSSGWESFPDCGVTPTYKDNSEWTFTSTDSSVNSGYYYNYWYEEEEEDLFTEEVVEEEVPEETWTEDEWTEETTDEWTEE
ncbi:MAG: PBP1A family penicillin-binding protein [Coriobacteriales bacterium]|jgi:1A family penicillin-binding protein|nr:PBP1A family penicillin-binding protein [Coriobacteriales bacterium]